MTKNVLRGSLLLFGASLLLYACGGENATGPTVTTEIMVVDNSFNPTPNQIASGQAVTWTWSGANQHSVTFDEPTLTGSATQAQGTFTQTFDANGEYTYYCTVHGRSVMSGKVVVGEATTGTGPGY